jgi:predicted metal-binding protein
MTTGNDKHNGTATESAVNDDLTVQSHVIPPRTVEDCNYCKLYGDSVMMPPHFASAGCKSGGRNHCTCGICF